MNRIDHPLTATIMEATSNLYTKVYIYDTTGYCLYLRPIWFKGMWCASNKGRFAISKGERSPTGQIKLSVAQEFARRVGRSPGQPRKRQIKVGAAIHRPLQHLEAIDLPLGRN